MTGWAGDVAIAVGGLIIGIAGGRLSRRREAAAPHAPAEAEASSAHDHDTAQQAAQMRKLRHDLRGALSPALLAADRLLADDNEPVRRSAEIVIRSLERATALIDATREPLPPAAPDAHTGGSEVHERKSA